MHCTIKDEEGCRGRRWLLDFCFYYFARQMNCIDMIGERYYPSQRLNNISTAESNLLYQGPRCRTRGSDKRCPGSSGREMLKTSFTALFPALYSYIFYIVELLTQPVELICGHLAYKAKHSPIVSTIIKIRGFLSSWKISPSLPIFIM